MTARRAGTMAAASVVATALLVVVLVTWASSIGPGDVLRSDGSASVEAPTESPTVSTDPSTSSTDDVEGERDDTLPWLRVVAVLLDVAVVVLLVVLAVRYLVRPLVRRTVRSRRGRRRRRQRADAGEVDFTVLEPPQAVAREILADASAQRQLLLEGDTPRDAVVACWHRFETQAAAAGLARRPWETSSEYTMRVLDLVDAYQPAVSRLGELYREARFSEHQLTEADRLDALDALDIIHRTIGVPA